MGMTFGEAQQAMREGKKCRRSGWNGKGMWIVEMPGFTIPADMVNERLARHVGRLQDVRCNPYYGMWTADGCWQPGWLASQTDMFATDWEVVD